MSNGHPADVSNYLRVQNGDLQDELVGLEQELQIARAELLAACINESSARSSVNHMMESVNHMTHYLGTLHDLWADPADTRSLQDVIEQRMADAEEARASAEALGQQLRTIEGSRAYRAVGHYRRLVERYLPAGSRRRALYRRLV